ncbi:unnamed protein product [Urochloa decumbens]|uniref:Uncharacterized protein n=1 Tax=Urochloa decumbens TaxID=240449 RepID=A0ABC9EA26_9POAL
MAARAMRYLQLQRLVPVPAAAARADHHVLRLREQLLLDSGRIFMLLGAVVLMYQLVIINPINNAAEHVFAAFLLWLLGVAFALLSLASRRFPELAAAGAAAATALRNYLLGGL